MVLSIAASVCVSAEEEENKKTVLFGDSLGTGYSLAGYSMLTSRLTEGSFISLLAKDWNLKNNETVYNYSVNGLTSARILNKVKEADQDVIKSAKYIIISAGGNDVLDTYGAVIMQAVMMNYKLLQENGLDKIDLSNINSLEQPVISLFSDPSNSELINKITDLCTSEEAQKTYASITEDYKTNLTEMITYLRSLNTDADIIILTPYDPLSIMEIDNKLVASASSTIKDMNKAASELLNDSSINSRLHIVDLSEAFKDEYKKLTNIEKFDIHPNEDGHSRIYQLLKNALEAPASETPAKEESTVSSAAPAAADNSEVPAATTNRSASESGFSMPDHVVYILFAAACLCIAGIVVVFVIKRVRKKKSGK